MPSGTANGMKVRLISSDQRLYRQCREALARFPDTTWDFAAGEAEDARDADLCIWDFQSDTSLPPAGLREERKNIYLVDRKDLGTLRDRLPEAAVGIVLKPVNQAALESFLEPAAAGRDDRDDLLQRLLEANLKLQEYDQDRTNFMARALHDFRTPLTAVSGYCGLLIGQHLGPLGAAQVEVLERMQHSIRRLARLATGMFQLSAGRQLKKQPELRPHDMEECIEQALHEILPLAEEKGIEVRTRLDGRAEPLWLEPAQIEQVLVNLLDNACKFTPKHGWIEISGYRYFWERRGAGANGGRGQRERRAGQSRAPNAFRVDVRDSGPGIAPEHLEAIFEEYTSYAGSQDRSSGGLGLAICRMIVTQHQGRVWAESNASGATLSFVVPLRAETGVADGAPARG